ncbi:MAG: hypothetical protein MJZ73_10305, partial [Bacteroidaceae bacterium]|nr:hypothetical protein [Bacteroidaceae bacterium]
MKRTMIMALVALMCCNPDVSAQGFLKKLGQTAVNAAKNAVENKVESKTREAVDDALDGKKGNNNKEAKEEAQEAPAANAPAEVIDAEAAGVQAKSDFVPGAVTLFEDKLTDEQVGEFPSKWNLRE